MFVCLFCHFKCKLSLKFALIEITFFSPDFHELCTTLVFIAFHLVLVDRNTFWPYFQIPLWTILNKTLLQFSNPWIGVLFGILYKIMVLICALLLILSIIDTEHYLIINVLSNPYAKDKHRPQMPNLTNRASSNQYQTIVGITDPFFVVDNQCSINYVFSCIRF